MMWQFKSSVSKTTLWEARPRGEALSCCEALFSCLGIAAGTRLPQTHLPQKQSR